MINPQCSCSGPTPNCPRYGWMMDFKYDICNGKNVSEENRDKLLDIWAGKSLPPLTEQISNFAQTLSDHIENNFEELSREGVRQRLQICQSCDRLTKDRQCNECGCPVDEKAKWVVSLCPLNKWPLPFIRPVGKSGCNCG